MRRMSKVMVMILLDLLLAAVGLWLAGEVRFEGQIPPYELKLLMQAYPLLCAARLFVVGAMNGYRSWSWRYADASDLKRLVVGITAGTAVGWAGIYLLGLGGISRFVLLAEFLFSGMLLSAYRFSLRIFAWNGPEQIKRRAVRRVLVVGAGEAGEMILREIKNNPDSDMDVVGFIDDDPVKLGTVIHGVRVLGSCAEIPAVAAERGVEEILIAIPSASGAVVREIVNACRRERLRFRVVPGILSIIRGDVTLEDVREFRVEDLLGRATVEADLSAYHDVVRGKRVLVTGAAGSIGSEISRQLARMNLSRLVLLDQSEENLFHIGRELMDQDGRIRPVLGSIRDEARLRRIFAEERPEIVYHAAAYKHVPVVELNAAEAVMTNVLATDLLARLAVENNAERFVIISSDKAVNPTSVMGATKFLAEQVGHYWHAKGKTSFCAVRFGNVLSSSGSVVPIFWEQIRKGGPVTVTHPEIVRYFMTIPEAVALVLTASFLSAGDEVFLLEMGEPVKIVDLAREMITLAGLRPEADIPIIFTGLRPGEKLYEELLVKGENAEPSGAPKIFKARGEGAVMPPKDFEEYCRVLHCWLADGGDLGALLRRGIPTYHPEGGSAS